MYEEFFGLQQPPFAAAPDPNCLYAPESVQCALDELLLRAISGAGIGILTAPAGTGKTLVCRRLALEFTGEFTPVYLPAAAVTTRRCLLQAILFELGRRYAGLDEQELRLELKVALRSLAHVGRSVVLLVDEAHLLGERLLEEIRSLASLDERGQPLMRIVLAGQSGLELRLMEPGLEAFNQRVASHVYLDPLSRAESREYVEYRVAWAGGDARQIFEAAALDQITHAAGGLPRCLNQLCDQTLLLGFARELPRVTATMVAEALDTLKQLPLRWNDVDRSIVTVEDSADEESDRLEFPVESLDLRSQIATPIADGALSFEIGTDDAESAPAVDVESFESAESTPVAELAHDPDVTSPLSDFDTSAVVHSLAISSACDPPSAAIEASISPAARRFEDELVIDSYAALDRQGAGGRPAFEPVERSSRDWDLPGVPSQPALPPVEDSAGIPDHDETLELVVPPESAIMPADSDIIELEEEIGSTLLETVLDVQKALEQVRDGSLVEAAPTLEGAFDVLDLTPEYDVVEPEHMAEHEAPAVPNIGRDRPAKFESRNANGVDEKPRYQNLFSTLRRKMGGASRRTG